MHSLLASEQRHGDRIKLPHSWEIKGHLCPPSYPPPACLSHVFGKQGTELALRPCVAASGMAASGLLTF